MGHGPPAVSHWMEDEDSMEVFPFVVFFAGQKVGLLVEEGLRFCFLTAKTPLYEKIKTITEPCQMDAERRPAHPLAQSLAKCKPQVPSR